jgi:hypothetical protein
MAPRDKRGAGITGEHHIIPAETIAGDEELFLFTIDFVGAAAVYTTKSRTRGDETYSQTGRVLLRELPQN